MSVNTTPATWVSGEIPTATKMNTEIRDFSTGSQAAWTSFSTTWTAATTQPTTSEHNITGAYHRVGKSIHGWWINIVLGSGNVGTGAWFFTLPVVQSGNMLLPAPVCSAVLWDVSASDTRVRTGTVFGVSTQRFTLRSEDGTAITGTTPWTWAAGDRILIVGYPYEAA